MPSQAGSAFEAMGREDLLRTLEMFAKNWLAHDGCWFLAAEERFGMETAIELDSRSWERYASAEARRIMTAFNIPRAGGLPALERALGLRMYSLINSQHIEWSEDGQRLRFVMELCRVQEARRRKGLPDFPCKSVGTVEFEIFARTPPDPECSNGSIGRPDLRPRQTVEIGAKLTALMLFSGARCCHLFRIQLFFQLSHQFRQHFFRIPLHRAPRLRRLRCRFTLLLRNCYASSRSISLAVLIAR
jgi:hypothetical protein